jgi:hypothetical protein
VCGSERRVRGNGYSRRRLPEPSVRILDGVSWESGKRVAVIPMYYFVVREKPHRLHSQSRLYDPAEVLERPSSVHRFHSTAHNFPR